MQNETLPSTEPALHVVSVDLALPGSDPSEQTDEPRFEDMGQGLAWGQDAARTLALTSKRECWVIDPQTAEIFFRVRASDIVIH